MPVETEDTAFLFLEERKSDVPEDEEYGSNYTYEELDD
jgi:hypothetical protein